MSGSKKNARFILVGIIMIVVVIGVVLFLVHNQSSEKQTNHIASNSEGEVGNLMKDEEIENANLR